MSDAELLQTLTPAERDALEALGEPGAYPPGAVIFEQGERPDCVLLVRAGRVRVAARRDGEEVLLSEHGPGELLGDLAGSDCGPWPATASALEEVRGVVVPVRGLRGFLLDHPRVALGLLELMSRRLREAEGRVVA